MKEDNNNKKKTNGAGFYIALCCCVAAMGIVGFVNSQKNRTDDIISDEYVVSVPTITVSPEPIVSQSPVVNAVAPKVVEDNDLKVSSVNDEQTDVIEYGESEEFYDGNVVQSITIADKPEFIMPARGEICNHFSGDKLVYDAVMGDYRTHDGIDIKADPDTDVVAAADGVVESVYVDTIGKAVIINHGNGYKTMYANLDDIENIEEGMELKSGDFIAHVGDYIYGEQTTQPHIHFEVIRNEESVNPEEYIK